MSIVRDTMPQEDACRILNMYSASKPALAGLPAALVLDVRGADEFAAGHVAGAVNVPLDALAAYATALPRDALVITVCGKGGGRSERAAAELRALGLPNTRSLCGGTQAWHDLSAPGA